MVRRRWQMADGRWQMAAETGQEIMADEMARRSQGDGDALLRSWCALRLFVRGGSQQRRTWLYKRHKRRCVSRCGGR